MASTYIQRINGTPDNRKKFTFSVWVKRAKLGTYQYIHGFQDNGVSDPRMTINFRDDDSFEYSEVNSTGTELGRLRPSMKFRDTSGWYAITVAVDTTLATADDRIKIWVNGEQQTSISVRVNYTQNFDTCIDDNRHTIGAIYNSSLSGYFDGSLSHYHYCDGYAYQASDFGEYDANGVWKIKTSPSVNYGTNGCFVLKDTNSGTDQSGNSNNLTISGGTLTKTEDSPSNVFATLNPLDNYYANSTLSNGNTSQTTHAGNYGWNASTLGMTSGKFYVEMKQTGFSGSSNYNIVGITSRQLTASNIYLGQGSEDWGYYAQGNGVYNGGSFLTTYASWTTNDIIGIALDLDNNKLYFSKNGTWQNSGVPTSGSTGTGAISITANKTYFFASGDYGTSLVCNNSWNFGNGYFGSTQISSAGTNTSGNGIFEYDVPTGYTALSTKGLNL